MAERDISIFEIVGPVMLGPSSSGTAGMARLGRAACEFLTGPLASISIRYHPRDTGFFGLRSHVALVGGVLGFEPYDPRLREALSIAKEQGIALSASQFAPDALPESALAVELDMVQRSGKRCTIAGVSVGGGSIAVTGIDGFSVSLSSTGAYVFIWSDAPAGESLQEIFPGCPIECAQRGEQYLYYVNTGREPDRQGAERGRSLPGVTRTLAVSPFLSLGYVPHQPLVTSFAQLLELSEREGKDIFEIAMAYERSRSGRSREEIWAEMTRMLEHMRQAVREGMSSPVKTLFGFGSGEDGRKLMRAIEEGKTLSGATLNRAVAKALSTMEVACAMGCVVAAPTAGSCGIVPGCLLTVQEDRGLPDEQVVKALFAAAMCGVVMYYHQVSFSGMGGGCQGEIGVSSAIAAAGLAYLGGGTTVQVTDACALALKNILGLICDRIGGSSEIPCIRRNGIGVSNAFCGADLALAGISSYVPPDEVVDALVDCERRLPPELRGGCGGLTSTPAAARAREVEGQVNASLAI